MLMRDILQIRLTEVLGSLNSEDASDRGFLSGLLLHAVLLEDQKAVSTLTKRGLKVGGPLDIYEKKRERNFSVSQFAECLYCGDFGLLSSTIKSDGEYCFERRKVEGKLFTEVSYKGEQLGLWRGVQVPMGYNEGISSVDVKKGRIAILKMLHIYEAQLKFNEAKREYKRITQWAQKEETQALRKLRRSGKSKTEE